MDLTINVIDETNVHNPTDGEVFCTYQPYNFIPKDLVYVILCNFSHAYM